MDSAKEYKKVYALHLRRVGEPADPQLAAAMKELRERARKEHERWLNDIDKRRENREGFLRLMAEWQEEYGAFTEEERARARAILDWTDEDR